MNISCEKIANLLIMASENILLKDIQPWLDKKHPHNKLGFRVGSGQKTYHRKLAENKHLITFGVKMILSKLESQLTASGWTTGREILSRNYFNSEVTPQTSLASVVLHEFAHYIQTINGQRHYGSVHNEHFYKILDRMHESGSANKVLNYLNSFPEFSSLVFFNDDKLNNENIDFKNVKENDIVFFKLKGNDEVITDFFVKSTKNKVFCLNYIISKRLVIKISKNKKDYTGNCSLPKTSYNKIKKGNVVYFYYKGKLLSDTVKSKSNLLVHCFRHSIPFKLIEKIE